MDNKKFAFVTVPVLELWNPSAALAALTPMIKRHGLEPQLIDINLELNEMLSEADWDQFNDWASMVTDQIDDQLIIRVLDIVDQHLSTIECGWLAFSVFSFYSVRPTALILSHLGKNSSRQHKILLGGSGTMSSMAEFGQKPFGQWCLENNLADYCIFGEGEQALDNLLSGNDQYPGINNTNFTQITNLDTLPLPEYSSFDFSRYKDSRVLLTGSRGCVRHCTFCDIDLTWPKYTYRSPHLIVEEMRRHVHELGVSKFEFTDSLINGSVSNWNKFNELLIEAKAKDPAMKDVSYMGQFICRNRTSMHSSTYELMHYAGCKQIHVGIEHFSERVRYHMKKKFSDADIDYHLEMSSRWHIPNIFLMIVGYPTETLQDHQQQLKAIEKYQIYAQTGAIFMLRWGLTMHIYENTPLTKMSNELQLSFTDNAFHDSVFNWVAGVNPTLDLAERIRRRVELHELSAKLGYSMPNTRKELASLLQLTEQMHLIKPPPKTIQIIPA